MKSTVRVVVFAMLVAPFLLNESFSADRWQMSQGSGMASRPKMLQTRIASKQLLLDPLPAGSYTIGVGGYFPTIDSAYRRLEAGGIGGPITLLLKDTLYVAPFPPGDFRLIGPIAGAGPASRITIRPADNVAVRIEGSGTATLTFEDVSYLTLDGISVDGSTRLKVHTSVNTSYSWNDAIDLWGNCKHVIVQNLTAASDRIDLATATILLASKDTTTVDSCVVSGVSISSGGIGIYVWGYNSLNRPKGNIIRGNHIGSPTDSLISRGVQVERADGTIVENNRVEHLAKKMTETAGLRSTIGINSYYGSNTIIRNNIVHGLRGEADGSLYGILASGGSSQIGQGVQIYNNMVYDLQNKSTTTAGYIGGITLWYNNNPLIAYNSIRLYGTSADPSGSDALALSESITNATIRNNILVNNYHITSSGGCTALWWARGMSLTSDHNDLVVDTTFANSSVVYQWNVGGYRTLGQWQGAGYDGHSVSVMPPFKGPYLHVDSSNASAKQLNGQGIALAGIEYDFDGQLRNAAVPDIGADEFVVPAPASWGTTWYKNSRNPVLSGGADGAWSQHVFMPCVLYNADSARYEMWFGASAGPGTPNWRPYRIGRAVSKDGINWEMNSSPVLTPDPGTWEKYTVEQPMVIRENGQYKMWYTGSPDFVVTMIGYATSPDGIHWTKHPGNPVMQPGTSGWEAGGPYSCAVKRSGSGYRMWYGAYGALSPYPGQIGYATSPDGITWQRDTVNNPVVRTGGQGQWDALWVITPQVLQIGDTHFMWYTGSYSTEGTRSGGLAVSNDMGMSWTKLTNPILQPTVNAWDGTNVELGTVLQRGDTLDMWYAGAGGSSYQWRIGHATTKLITRVNERAAGIAQEFILFQNYPNPFNPRTGIRFQVPGVSDVKITVYDILGREVTVMVNEKKQPGSYELSFDGSRLASGVYIYRLTAGSFVQSRKMVLLK